MKATDVEMRTPLSPDPVSAIQAALLAHYDRTARNLPWRWSRDPYRVLVSEVMLQQTRVETVVGYYERWLERFPTVDALARASEDEVLKAWEGLGYYRRARNLHRAAGVVREMSGIPSTSEGLRALPGVGQYTAGAVASIAFGEPVPAVDGNVRRVLSRLYDEPRPTPRWLSARAGALVDAERPGDWNQALMELGATVCTPRAPSCEACPVEPWCAARAAGTQLERPVPAARKPVPRALFTLAVLESEGRVLVRRRPTGGLLGGMWAFPEREELDVVRGRHAEAARRIARNLGLKPVGEPGMLEPVAHRYSHLDATYVPVVFEVAMGDDWSSEYGSDSRWIEAADDGATALPVAQRKVLEAWVAARTGVSG